MHSHNKQWNIYGQYISKNYTYCKLSTHFFKEKNYKICWDLSTPPNTIFFITDLEFSAFSFSPVPINASLPTSFPLSLFSPQLSFLLNLSVLFPLSISILWTPLSISAFPTPYPALFFLHLSNILISSLQAMHWFPPLQYCLTSLLIWLLMFPLCWNCPY